MKKSIKHALFSGLLLPGLGQLKNGDKIKAFVFFFLVIVIVGGFTYSIGTVMSSYFKALLNIETMGDTRSILGTYLTAVMKSFVYWGLAGSLVWGISALDAYLVANRKWGDKED
jgi:hypothetical protein